MNLKIFLVGVCGAATFGLVALGANSQSSIVPMQQWTPQAVMTNNYEASPTFTPDGREMYYISASKTFSSFRILVSRCQNGQWSEGLPVSFAAQANINEADPFVTHDGRRLYFISARHDPQNEDFDIYYVDKTESGNWGMPVRMPSPVNSEAAELLPRSDKRGRLYFGSARPGGYGQSDIYTAVELSSGVWRTENVGPPVSTEANEYEAEISRNGRTMIIVADRGDRSHLYIFRKKAGRWKEGGRVPARSDVFQVGPTLSPQGERLLFAQTTASQSGEIFLTDIKQGSKESWPPTCN